MIKLSNSLLQLICSVSLLFLTVRDPMISPADGYVIHKVYEEHLECFIQVDIVDGVPQTIANKSCEYADYYKASVKKLNTVATLTVFEKIMYNEIICLYSNLERSLTPRDMSIPESSLPAEHIDRKVQPIHPISFGVPSHSILNIVPSKAKPFFSLIPGVKSSYMYSANDESQYFKEISESLFAWTYKKGGWDCFRHLEILSQGTIPLFPGIDNCPTDVLSLHPKSLYEAMLKQPGLTYSLDPRNDGARYSGKLQKFDLDINQVNKELYSIVVEALLRYTSNVLSTTAIANYIIKTMYSNSKGVIKHRIPRKLLYLTHECYGDDWRIGDYLVDLSLHGLICALGWDSVDAYPERLPIMRSVQHFNQSDSKEIKKNMYGFGFGYSASLNSFSSKRTIDFNQVTKNIENHVYDYIIVGSAHRHFPDGKIGHFSTICKHYSHLEVAVLHGGDFPITAKELVAFAPCAGHFFSREGFK